jgi:hypothetical protein
VTAAAAGASLAFTALCVACLAYLHLAPTGYSPVRNAVSEYGVGEFAAWYRTQAAAAGLAGAALAVALDGPTRVVVLLGVFAAARLAITQAPLDARWVVYWLLAVLAFGSITLAAIRLDASQHATRALGWTMAAFVLLSRSRGGTRSCAAGSD